MEQRVTVDEALNLIIMTDNGTIGADGESTIEVKGDFLINAVDLMRLYPIPRGGAIIERVLKHHPNERYRCSFWVLSEEAKNKEIAEEIRLCREEIANKDKEIKSQNGVISVLIEDTENLRAQLASHPRNIFKKIFGIK